MKRESGRQFTLPSSLLPYLPCEAGGTLLRLHSPTCSVKSSECRTIGRSPGHNRRGKWWEATGHLQSWVEGLLDPEAVVVLTGQCSFQRLHHDHRVGALGLLPTGECFGPMPLCPWEATCSQPMALLGDTLCKSYPGNWGGWGDLQILMEFVPGQGALVQCPHNSLLGPGFPLIPSGSMEAWAKLCALSPQCSAS
jgi:hypothetical protein